MTRDEVVNEMPPGQFLTAAQIAFMIGTSQNTVGRLLGSAYASRQVERRPATPDGRTSVRWEWMRP